MHAILVCDLLHGRVWVRWQLLAAFIISAAYYRRLSLLLTFAPTHLHSHSLLQMCVSSGDCIAHYSYPFPMQVNYFPSRFDPVRHSEKYPYQNMKVSGNREKMCIAKENNFAQAGARFRSFDPARQERFINRIAGMLTAPRVTQVCSQLKLQLTLHSSTYLSICSHCLVQKLH